MTSDLYMHHGTHNSPHTKYMNVIVKKHKPVLT